jgi:hypothetical protein
MYDFSAWWNGLSTFVSEVVLCIDMKQPFIWPVWYVVIIFLVDYFLSTTTPMLVFLIDAVEIFVRIFFIWLEICFAEAKSPSFCIHHDRTIVVFLLFFVIDYRVIRVVFSLE